MDTTKRRRGDLDTARADKKPDGENSQFINPLNNAGEYSAPGSLRQMPVSFGAQPGGMAALVYRETVTASARYKTDGERLARLLPPGFTLLGNEIMVAAMMNRGVEWMGGEPYNILAVNVPARFTGTQDDISGWYNLVVWEDNATPILPGREGAGIAKIPASVEAFRFDGDQMRTWAHRNGHSFCDLHFTNIRKASEEEAAFIDGEFSSMNWMGWRHLPALGAGGGADLSHATLFPQEFTSSAISLADAEIAWTPPPLWKLPTQAHIIEQLAALPVLEASGQAVLMDARCVLRSDLTRALI